MRKAQKQILSAKLPNVLQKLEEILKQEGLADFEIKNINIVYKGSRRPCPNPGDEPCLVPTPTGYKTICVPKGTCGQ